MAARERRRIQALVNRSRAGAKRAVKGLRFISRSKGSVEAAELWRRVEDFQPEPSMLYSKNDSEYQTQN
jgi:respiratory burst oxidase